MINFGDLKTQFGSELNFNKMQKQELIKKLQLEHNAFTSYILNLDEKEFLEAKEGKWTAGQQMEHIRQSVQAINLALSLPKFALKLFFGKSNRPSKTNEELIDKYQLKLKNGGRAPRAFQPKKIELSNRSELNKKLNSITVALARKINKFHENELDEIILPHPLLGKITLREMIYFTNYHVQHHQLIIQQNLEN